MGREREPSCLARSLGLMGLVVGLTACSSGSEQGSSDESLESTYVLSGSIGDGPIIDADIVVRDAFGEIITAGISDDQANYEIDIPNSAALPVTLHVTGGTDLVTDREADFELVAMAGAPGMQTVNVSPLTTLAVKAAECRGTTTDAGMNDSWDVILRRFNTGLDAQELGDPMTQTIDRNNVETAVLANEALGELVRRTGASFGGSVPLDLILDVLACDVADGELNGRTVGSTGQDEARIYAVARTAELSIRLEVLAGRLEVDGEDATAAMNGAIRTIMPGAVDPNVNNVPITQASIDAALAALDDLSSVLPDPELAEIRSLLERASPLDVTRLIGGVLDAAMLATLQGMPGRIAVSDASTIAAFDVDSQSADAGADPASEDAVPAQDAPSQVNSGETSDPTISNGEGADTVLDDGTGGVDAGSATGEAGDNAGIVNTGSIGEPPAVQLSVSDSTPPLNSTVVVTWSSTAASSCQANGGWDGAKATSGEETSAIITRPMTFTLSCANDAGSNVAMVSVTPIGNLVINWQAPTENVDGSPVSGLTAYRIHYGTQSGQYSDVAEAAGNATSYTLNVPMGDYYIAMTAVDIEGDESGLSNEVTLTAR